MTAAGAAPVRAPFIVNHEVIDEHTDGVIEICVPTPQGVTVHDGGSSEVEWQEVPATTAASTIHRGPYAEIAPAYHTLSGWTGDHGHQIQGPPREIYLDDPETIVADDLLTEVQFPIEDPA